MNRFRKHKKAKEVVVEDQEVASPVFSLKPSKKKAEPEPTPDFDLSAALPPTDNFRTSLLMPKLSARFSMLKEQDDPLSLLGKASDDSVLFPKRASRLNLFGHSPAMLADIDEVCSNDSRPSLALDRGSFASGGDGYGTDDDRSQTGSMMSRARRAEGNNLFGGRQKIYKIPVRSPGALTPDTPDGGPRGMGKPVYDHDMNLSAFQRLRLKEKEERTAEATRESGYAASTASSNSRATYSSTASGPLSTVPTSTGATPADESPLNTSKSPVTGYPFPETLPEAPRPGSAMSTPRNGSIRNRRLYGQGLTQAAQTQQSSTLNRLESLSRQRAGTPDLPSLNRNYSRSAGNLRERLQKLSIVEPASTSRPTSPPLSATSPNPRMSGEAAVGDRPSPTSATFGANPPLSPPTSENDERASLLAASINPEDHGKATAMGLFNRPATGFDEQAFSRRQLQLHQGRETPPPRRASPPRRPLPAEAAGRARGLSKSSYRSRAESASSHYSSDAHRGMDRSCASSVEASPFRPGVRTFYANSSDSESEDERENTSSHELSSTSLTTEYGPPLQHSSEASNQPPTPTRDRIETLPEVRPIEESDLGFTISSPEVSDNTPKRPDSPTLQPDQGFTGMGGMVRSHLRQESDISSIFPPPSPRPAQHRNDGYFPKTETQESTPQPPAALPMIAQPCEESRPSSVTRPGTSSSQSPSGHSAEGTGSRNSEESSAHGTTPDTTSVSNGPSWREELERHHRRNGSTETQREREAFAVELAERRRKVQEKLRSVAGNESRSSSPTPGRSTPDLARAGNAFAMLKQKSNKQAGGKPDQKKLFGYAGGNSSTPVLPDDSWREEERPSFGFGRHSNSSSPHIGSERSLRSRMPSLSRDNSYEGSRESSRSRGHSPFRDQRDRAGSDASGRSKSRTRLRERDDLQTVDEGSIIAHENFVIPEGYEPPVPLSRPTSSRPSTEMSDPVTFDRTSSAASGRQRSTSRSGTPSFQFERPFQFSQSNTSSIIGASPRAPPAAPAYSANATPPLTEIPAEGSSTSLGSSGSNILQRGAGQGSLLKRPVNKKQISEPTFVSSTSNVPLVGLPPGAAMPSPTSAPPVPPMNPRRRRGTATQTILGAFKSDKNEFSRVSSPAPSTGDEHSVFTDEEKRPHSRNLLRKTSSEAGNLNTRARGGSMTGTPPAVPEYPAPSIPVDGGMF
ncbi:unnamed protein product [Penicillium glandicola]